MDEPGSVFGHPAPPCGVGFVVQTDDGSVFAPLIIVPLPYSDVVTSISKGLGHPEQLIEESPDTLQVPCLED